MGTGANPRYECCTRHGAVVALDAATGKQLWVYDTMEDAQYTSRTNALGVKLLWRKAVTPDCANGRKKRLALCGERYGLSAAPLVVDQSVIAAGVDGRVYIYDAASGDVMWQYDALRDFETVNGAPGKGGGIDSQSIAAGDGMVFIGAGYGSFNQPAGNVVLAFRPKAAAK